MIRRWVFPEPINVYMCGRVGWDGLLFAVNTWYTQPRWHESYIASNVNIVWQLSCHATVRCVTVCSFTLSFISRQIMSEHLFRAVLTQPVCYVQWCLYSLPVCFSHNVFIQFVLYVGGSWKVLQLSVLCLFLMCPHYSRHQSFSVPVQNASLPQIFPPQTSCTSRTTHLTAFTVSLPDCILFADRSFYIFSRWIIYNISSACSILCC